MTTLDERVAALEQLFQQGREEHKDIADTLVSPLDHQLPSPLKQVRAKIGGFGRVSHNMR